MKKKIMVFMLVLVLSFSFVTVFAMGHKKSMDEKLFKKIHIALNNEETLGLSQEQIDMLKAIKHDTKKELIMDQANIDILALDIKSGLWQDSIDPEEMQDLVNKKYEIKKEKAMSIINAYAQFKETLSDEQMEQLKNICEEMKKKMYEKCMKN